MRPLFRFPDVIGVDFIGKRAIALAFSAALTVASLVSLATQGLNLGIDFQGGILIEARAQQDIDLGPMREKLGGLGLGEVALSHVDSKRDIMIRIERQEGGEKAQAAAIDRIKEALGTGIEYRRTESVGPTVGRELLIGGVIATLLGVLAIAVYVWVRFEWQFGVSAMVATFHDMITTFGLFSIFQIDFDMTSVAAILTIIGYSINDTVVVFDRIRENLRKYKSMPLGDLMNLSVNQTMARTIMTGLTTQLAIFALLVFGGPVLFGFSVAMTWGIVIGTYSSIYMAAALLMFMPSPRVSDRRDDAAKAGAAPAPKA